MDKIINEKKVVLITGTSSGIGLKTALFLNDIGYKVYGISRRNSQGLPFKTYPADVTNPEEMFEIISEIFATEGQIDCLINNAGMGIAGAVEHHSFEDIDKLFDVNLKAQIKMCKLIIPFLRLSGGGKIINIGSVAGEIPIPFQACYSASKAAITSFSMALSLEVAPFNIFVTTLLPGDTKTGFTGARQKNTVMTDSFYKDRIIKSVERMEKDEQNGLDPITVSKLVQKVLHKKNPPPVITVGIKYKFVVFLSKILPKKLMLKIIKKMYA